MKDVVEKIIKALVSDEASVEITEKQGEKGTVIEVRVGAADMGRLIGREGRTIKAIRSLLYAAGQKQGKRFVLDVIEE